MKQIIGFILLFLVLSCSSTEDKDFHDHPHDADHHTEHAHDHDTEHQHENETKKVEDVQPQEPVTTTTIAPPKYHHEHVLNEAEVHEHDPEHQHEDNVPADKIEDKVDEHQPVAEQSDEPAPDSSVKPEPESAPKQQQFIHAAPQGRQFHHMYQPIFPQPTGFNMIRRQFGGGMEILGDIVMMSMIGLPILGLLTVGSSSIANFLGFGSSGSSKSSSKRNKRSLKETAEGAVEYAKNLWDIMEQLERAFEKHNLYQIECRLQAVCEAHQKNPRLGSWGQTILQLMRKEKELESREMLPLSRFLFSSYTEAAQQGSRENSRCEQLYPGCSTFINAQQNEV